MALPAYIWGGKASAINQVGQETTSFWRYAQIHGGGLTASDAAERLIARTNDALQSQCSALLGFSDPYTKWASTSSQKLYHFCSRLQEHDQVYNARGQLDRVS